jgi:hypothetical protein
MYFSDVPSNLSITDGLMELADRIRNIKSLYWNNQLQLKWNMLRLNVRFNNLIMVDDKIV